MSADLIMGLVLAAAFLAGALMLAFGTAARISRRRAGGAGRSQAALAGGQFGPADGGGHCGPADGGAGGCDGGGGS